MIFDLFLDIWETAFNSLFKRVMETREPGIVSDEYTYEDGRKGGYEVRAHPAQTCLLVITSDITERK